MEAPALRRCPKCGKKPLHETNGTKDTVSCCGLKGSGMGYRRAAMRWNAAVVGYRNSCAAWDRAMGIPTDEEIEKKEISGLMRNVNAEKRLNRFNDGRLMM